MPEGMSERMLKDLTPSPQPGMDNLSAALERMEKTDKQMAESLNIAGTRDPEISITEAREPSSPAGQSPLLLRKILGNDLKRALAPLSKFAKPVITVFEKIAKAMDEILPDYNIKRPKYNTQDDETN